jgi:adenosine deaminase/aminodeoxyfutalosine deaminase
MGDEETLGLHGFHRNLFGANDNGNLSRVRQKGANFRTARNGVRSENLERVTVIAFRDGVDLGSENHTRHAVNIVTVDDFCSRLRKAELHVHLEGAIEPATLREINPALGEDEIRRQFGYADFAGFLQCFKWVVLQLRGPEDYALAARRLFERLAAENVTYAEVTLSAGVVLWRKQDLGAVYDAVRTEAARSQVDVWWVFDCVRQFGVEAAWPAARAAVERARDRVVAFGIGGDEAAIGAREFGEVFEFARRAGLKIVPHAGETGGPESVRQALDAGADRIGHGIGAAADAALMSELRDRDVPLEVCITSNARTGAVAALEAHPVRRLFDAGVPIVLNTDDPALFGCSLSGEYRLAGKRFGFSENELAALAANGFRYAFRAADTSEKASGRPVHNRG